MLSLILKPGAKCLEIEAVPDLLLRSQIVMRAHVT